MTRRSVIAILVVLLAAAIVTHVAATDQAAPAATAPATGPVDIAFELGDAGLKSLQIGGQEMLAEAKLDAFGHKGAVVRSGDEYVQTCPWGTVTVKFSGSADRLTAKIVLENTSSSAVERQQIRLLSLKFAQPPMRTGCDPGQFGFGRGTTSGGIPIGAGRTAQPPVITFNWPQGKAAWCADNLDDNVTIISDPVFDGNAALKYPLSVAVYGLAAGQRKEITCSLRTAPVTADAFDPAADLLAAFGKKYPMKLKWDDHRPIGMMNLQGYDPTRADANKNPRNWLTIQGGRPDITTPEGRAAFTAGVLKLADGSIKTLLDADAQGMITWDIEGGQIGNCVYYGTPHLQPKLAPEMEEPVEIEANEAGVVKTLRMPVVDAYFRKFRQAGLRVGVCLRPQGMRQDANGRWSQEMLSDEDAFNDLKTDIDYARKRWGCTLFYIDTTITKSAADANRHELMAPWVLEKLYQQNPDILLIPENQMMRYHTVSAPLDSLSHHAVADTFAPIRRVWPTAFICTIATDGARAQGQDRNSPEQLEARRARMVAAAKAGDIFLIAGWYMNSGTKDIMNVQALASGKAPASNPASKPAAATRP